MANATNVLTQGIEINGSIKFSNDMIIDGKVDGEIASEKGKVTIFKEARRSEANSFTFSTLKPGSDRVRLFLLLLQEIDREPLDGGVVEKEVIGVLAHLAVVEAIFFPFDN